MKKYIITIVMLVLAISLFTTNPQLGGALKAETKANPILWSLLETKDNVKIYRAYTICDNSIKVIIKVENLNAYKVKVSWDSKFNLSGNIIPINKPFVVLINANETIGGSCSNSELLLDPYKYVTELKKGVSDYQINDLKIEKL